MAISIFRFINAVENLQPGSQLMMTDVLPSMADDKIKFMRKHIKAEIAGQLTFTIVDDDVHPGQITIQVDRKP